MTKIFKLLFFVIIIYDGAKSQECGVPKVGLGKIFGGNIVTRGQFPW
jgi:hypothetical protein